MVGSKAGSDFVVSGDEEEAKTSIEGTCLMDDMSMSLCLSENTAGVERIINTVIQDDTPLGKLIHDLLCIKPEEMTGKLAEYVEKRVLAEMGEAKDRENKLKEELAEKDRKLQEEAEEKRKLKEEAAEKRKWKEEAEENERKLQNVTEVFGDLDGMDHEKIPLLRDYIKELNDYKE